MTTFNAETVRQLEQLDDAIYQENGLTSRPAGKKWVYIVLDLARRLTDNTELLKATGPAELDQLTTENFHTMRTAAEIALHLQELNS